MIERINELAKIAKTRQLTKEEEKERKELREQYIKNFKNRFQNELNEKLLTMITECYSTLLDGDEEENEGNVDWEIV